MQRQAFIDWMKATGMFVIVVGHVIGSPHHIFNLVSQPAYTKQIGVCFFIFIMGWSLANEKRNKSYIVFKRAFPIFFYGILFALLISVIKFISIGDINESNYLPFFLGVNVFFNFFPANPTTWYIGTYLHILLFWYVFMRNRATTKTHLILAVVIELIVRGILLYQDLDFVAYMTLPNWLTVFVLGSYLHNKTDDAFNRSTLLAIIIWLAVITLWASSFNQFIASNNFPFRDITAIESENVWWLDNARSALISIVYIFNTLLLFEILRRVPLNIIVSFFARNSLITFIIHMPLIYASAKYFYSAFEIKWVAQCILILSIFIGCAIISECINRLINLPKLQAMVWSIWKSIYSSLIGTTNRKKS